MLRRILFLLLLLGCAASAFAQNTTQVTATIVDPNGIPYSFATYQAQLVPNGITPQVPPPCNNQSAVACIASAFSSGAADINGTFKVSLASNAVLIPGGTQWQFTININGVAPPLGFGPQKIVALVTVSGATQDISSTLNALAPALARVTSGGGGFTPAVNGTPLPSAGLNLINSVTNACGLSSTFTNTAGVNVKSEIAGTLLAGCLPATAALTTNPLSQFAATTSAQLRGVINDETGTGLAVFNTSPTLVTPNLGVPSAIDLSNSTNLPVVPASDGGTGAISPSAHGQLVAEGAGAMVSVVCSVTGQVWVANNAADPSCQGGGLPGTTVAGTSDTVQCDSATTTIDRLQTKRYTSGSAIAVVLPQAGSSGCGGNFTFSVLVTGAGTATFTTTTSLITFNSSATVWTTTSAGGSVPITPGQFATFSSPDNANWIVRISQLAGAGGGSITVNGSGSITNLSSTTPAAPTSNPAAAVNVQFQGSGANASAYATGFFPRPNLHAQVQMQRPIGGSNAFTGVGEANGNVANATGRNVPTTTTPATITLSSTAAGGTFASLLGSQSISPGTNTWFYGDFKLAQTTNERFWKGLSNATPATIAAADNNPTSHAALLRFSTGAGDTNWTCVLSNGTSQTTTPSSVAADTAYHHLNIVENTTAGHWLFILDGTQICDLNTNLPTSSLTGIEVLDQIGAGAAISYNSNGYYLEAN